jgi:predicted dehydrogenase
MIKLNVLIVGGGMISQEVLFPVVFQQRQLGKIGDILVATRRASTINTIQKLFPNEHLLTWPDPKQTSSDTSHPDIYLQAMKSLKTPGVVMVATPDHLHTPVILEAIKRGFDVIVQKPLCLKTSEAWQIIKEADAGARYVYSDFHKRHDYALRSCQYKYRRGQMGEALCSHAWIEERREMPLNYFALWAEQSSSFEYIGCHYVDLFHYITGELPKKVIAFGQKKFLPKHGKNAYDATQAIIEWQSGAVQYVQTSWVLPDGNPNLTNQGFQITCTEGEFRADNADRNSNFVTTGRGFERYNPHFFKPYLDWDHPERDYWAGYGGESVIQPINDILEIYKVTENLSAGETLAVRKKMLMELDQTRPLPRQALIATAVVEAARTSLEHNNQPITFNENLIPQLG